MTDIDSFRHRYCRNVFSIERKRLGIKCRDVDIIQFSKNDSHWEVHLPYKFSPQTHGNMGVFQGCCKWSAGFECLIKIQGKALV